MTDQPKVDLAAIRWRNAYRRKNYGESQAPMDAECGYTVGADEDIDELIAEVERLYTSAGCPCMHCPGWHAEDINEHGSLSR